MQGREFTPAINVRTSSMNLQSATHLKKLFRKKYITLIYP